MGDPHEMFAAYLDGRLNAEQVAELEQWLREDRQRALLFVRTAMLDNHLGELLHEQNVQDVADELYDDSQFGALLQALDAPDDAVKLVNLTEAIEQGRLEQARLKAERRKAERRETLDALKLLITPRLLITAGSIAAAIAIAVVLIVVLVGGEPDKPTIANQPDSGPQPSQVPQEPTKTRFAQLIAEKDARWDTPGIVVGDHFSSTSLHLQEGHALLRMSNGAIVTLQAPVEVRPDQGSRLELTRGRVTVQCYTPESKRFVVFTDTAEVTDLGTVFGVERDAAGWTTTGVMEGHVALTLAVSGSEPRLMKAGELAQVRADGIAAADPVPETMGRFNAWDHVLREVAVTGEAVLVDRISKRLGEDNDFVRVFREATGVMTEKPLAVSRTETGLYHPMDAQTTTIDSGIRADSYLIHFDRVGTPTHRDEKRFTIRFNQPVVAMMLSKELLRESDEAFGIKGMQYPSGPRGVENELSNPDDDTLDSIELSEDRKTLIVTLNTADLDQIRVLTQSPKAAWAK